MNISPKNLIERQVPSYIREASPLFVKFLQYYYEYNEQQNIQKHIQRVLENNDVDVAESRFVNSFFEELKLLPANIVADKKLIAKHIYDLYSAKGTEKAVQLLFRIVFNEEITVQYPSENILKASDGRWNQQSIVTLQRLQGTNTSASKIRFTTNNISNVFDILTNELIDVNIVRIFFDLKIPFSVNQSTTIELLNSNNTTIGIYQLLPTINGVSIINGGKQFRIGELIRIGGTKNTLLQVTAVDSFGEISKLKIIDFGYNNSVNDITVLPSTLLNLVGIPYMDTEYVDVDYVMNSLPEIEDSIATINLKYSLIGKTSGYYSSEHGKISSDYSKLQDNYFYQIFSYVIQTQQSITKYNNIIKNVHPAGMKYFSVKDANIELESSITIESLIDA